MNDLSQTAFEEAHAVTQTSWMPPEAPLAMPRQRLEADTSFSVLGWIVRLLIPLRRV